MRIYHLALSCGLALNIFAAAPEKMLVLIGTYTGGASKGIYSYELNMKDGTLRDLGLAAESSNPSFLAVHPNRKWLYAVSETGRDGSVAGFKIDPKSGKLAHFTEAGSRGAGPCHLTVDKTGRNVLVANYGGGSVTVLPINQDGELQEASSFIQHSGSSVNKQRQSAPHAHSINPDPNNRFVVVADLGLDKLLVYRFDPARGTLNPNDPPFVATPPGGGPRHFAFHPDGSRAYVNNEMLSSVTALSYDPERGVFQQTQTLSTLPEDWSGNNSTAEIQVHPSGKFVYCSNRGHNSIAVFSLTPGGTLKYIENESTRGRTPRNFGIDPTGAYLIAANQDSDSLAVFRIDPQNGSLEPLGEPVPAPRPVCVKFLPRE